MKNRLAKEVRETRTSTINLRGALPAVSLDKG
jgi:hypothetical protein